MTIDEQIRLAILNYFEQIAIKSTSRKVVQFDYSGTLTVLLDDGTLWHRIGGFWQKIETPT